MANSARDSIVETMQSIIDTAESENRSLNREEAKQFDNLERELRMEDARGGFIPNATRNGVVAHSEVPEIQGKPGEKLVRGQSMTEYVRRAAENGVNTQLGDSAPRPMVYRDNEYLNEYWGRKMGFSNGESRALAEDTGGSGLAVVPQSWTAQVVEYLYADSVLGQLGVTTVPMPTEIYNVPVQTAPVQPAWLAENASIGLDANPAFSTIALNAKGGFKDITLYSLELAQDAYVQGSLPGFLAQSCARNMALAVDAAGILGVAGNAGNPGLNAEAGFVFRHYTGDAGTTGFTPVDTKELSQIAQVTRGANAHVTGFLSNHKVYGTYSRVSTATAFPMFWPRPADVADVPWVTTTNTNVVPSTETDPATASTVAQTTGTMSSIYAGPWPYMMLGVHLALNSRVLTERYVDTGQVGLFNFMRFSIRTANPQTFSRTIGLLTP